MCSSADFTPSASLLSFVVPQTGKTKPKRGDLKMKTEIQKKLEQLAFNRTTPFCYGSYIKAPKVYVLSATVTILCAI